MRKSLDIAGRLVHPPKVLLVDETTMCLDIQTRYKIWDYIKKIHNEFSISIFLTTHYMEEADKLCDNISIIDHGKIKVTDSPNNLKSSLGNEVVIFEMDSEVKSENLIFEMRKISTVKDISADGLEVTVLDRKSTRLNSSHANISYAVFC